MLQLFPRPVLYEPIDSMYYINQSDCRIAEKYKKCLTITHLHVQAEYGLSNGENDEHQKYFANVIVLQEKSQSGMRN